MFQFSRKMLSSYTCTSPGKSVCGQPNLSSSCTSLVPRIKRPGDKATCALVLSSLCVDYKTLATSVT